MKIIISLFIIIISIFTCSCQFSTFSMDLYSYQERCLHEYYQSSTVIIYNLYGRSKNMEMKIKSPDQRVLFNSRNDSLVFSVTTPTSGYYTVCAKSYQKEPFEVFLTIRSGVGARDFSSVAKTKDLEPIDIELEKLLSKEKTLNHFSSRIVEKQKEFNTIYDKISSKIILYSLLMIAGMVVIGVVETLYLKRFMEKRKII